MRNIAKHFVGTLYGKGWIFGDAGKEATFHSVEEWNGYEIGVVFINTRQRAIGLQLSSCLNTIYSLPLARLSPYPVVGIESHYSLAGEFTASVGFGAEIGERPKEMKLLRPQHHWLVRPYLRPYLFVPLRSSRDCMPMPSLITSRFFLLNPHRNYCDRFLTFPT